MSLLFKILKWTGLFLGGIIFLTVILLYIFRVDYILKGIYVTYLQGHNTAYLADYKFFDNHIIENDLGDPWPKSSSYNVIKETDSLVKINKEQKTVAYLLIHQDSLVFESYYGGYTDSSKSNSFSMAKSIVSALLGKSIEQGTIKNLQQKVKDFVPEIEGPFADSLSFEDLVAMRSGMKWEEDYYNPFSITTRLYFDQNMMDLLPAMPIIEKPGEKFKYQSGDTQLLGIALQRANKSSLSQLTSEFFWKPFGATHNALWQVDSKSNGIEKAYCCIASNAKDFARFGKLYLHHGKWGEQQLLDSSYIAHSINQKFSDSPTYGYGWWMGQYHGKKYFYMDGHLGQYVIVIPEDDLIIVRLGHTIDTLSRENPESAFNQFINQGYKMLGTRISK